MSKLTQEAILAELAKLSDSKGKAMSFYDGQTIVPNSLLEQVWLEAERKTEERIIKLLEDLRSQMLALQQPGHKDLTGNMAIRAKGVEIAINTIKEKNKSELT